MFKPFYVHINHGPGPLPSKWARGATILVSPIEGDDRNVHMQVTVCSRKDQFCKKTGREEAAKQEKFVVNKRVVPHRVADIGGLTINTPKSTQWNRGVYDYLYRYML